MVFEVLIMKKKKEKDKPTNLGYKKNVQLSVFYSIIIITDCNQIT